MKLKSMAMLAVGLAFVGFAAVNARALDDMNLSPDAPDFKVFRLYSDASSPDNHYAPSGWMGDYGDLKVDQAFPDRPHTGTTSIKVSYTGEGSQGARWAGIYWQEPANNWGNRPGGFDLTGATKLVFWARGENGDEHIAKFGMGGISGKFPDTTAAAIGPLVLKTEWTQYEVDLSGRDLSSIIGGFVFAANVDDNPNGLTFYLDDIRYE
ncbi:MAG: hypothetical protein HQL11_00855 [Candidatus Omnitrophica bacterium]|nr:hypothetical protein [Candidatus Omnitrophota bacterium]